MRNIKQKMKLFYRFTNVKLDILYAIFLFFICYAEGAKIVDFSTSDLKSRGVYNKYGRFPTEWIADGNDIASEIPFEISDNECFFNKMPSKWHFYSGILFKVHN